MAFFCFHRPRAGPTLFLQFPQNFSRTWRWNARTGSPRLMTCSPRLWSQYFSSVIKVPSGLFSGDGLDHPLSDGEFNQLLLEFTNLPPAELSDEDWLNLPVEVGAAPFELEGVDECQDLEAALKSIDSMF